MLPVFFVLCVPHQDMEDGVSKSQSSKGFEEKLSEALFADKCECPPPLLSPPVLAPAAKGVTPLAAGLDGQAHECTRPLARTVFSLTFPAQ